MRSKYYTGSYYEGLRDGSMRSAEVIVPLVLQLLKVQSVVDVGCGIAVWLAAFRRFGVRDVIGIDGEYVDRDALQIPQERFQVADLRQPVILERTFDLAISLEVAEHLPPRCATVFVESLVGLAPAVLFSAAIPFQGGTHHLNEQWPDEWADLFKVHGYVPVDFIREKVWRNEAVDFWYAQNTLLFVRHDLLEVNGLLKAEFERTNCEQLRLVHPRQYVRLATSPGLKMASRIFLRCLRNAIQFRLHSIRRRPRSSGKAKS